MSVESEVYVLLGLFQRNDVSVRYVFLFPSQLELTEFIEWRRLKFLFAESNLRWLDLLWYWTILSYELSHVRLHRTRSKRDFLTIDPLHQFKVKILQSMARPYVETRLQNCIYRSIKLVASLLAFVVFEIELAFSEVIFGRGDYLLNVRIGLLHRRRNVTRRRPTRYLAMYANGRHNERHEERKTNYRST
jgi:hypothetical protein